MNWTLEESEAETEVSIWLLQQKRERKKKLGRAIGFLVALFGATWIGVFALNQIGNSYRQHEAWLQENGCKVTSRKKGEWEYHIIMDYWEHRPGEVCYKCSKTGESFCEED